MVKMIAIRRARILALIAEAGEELSVADLVRRLGRVSAVTVRRDIAALASKGLIERTHGGALQLSAAPKPREPASPAEDVALRDELDGIDAVVLPPIGGRGAETLRLLARRHHIPFLAESAPQVGGVYLGPDNFTAGRELGRMAGNLLNGKIAGARVLLISLEHLPNTRARCDGYIKGFGECFQGSVRQWRIDGQGSFRVALRASIDAFSAHPDINVIFGVNDHSVLAGIEASDRCGVAGVSAFSVGVEGALLLQTLAGRGKLLACAALFPEIVGIRAIETLVCALQGGEMPKEVATPHRVITPDTLERYYRQTPSGWVLAPEAEAAILGSEARPSLVRSIGPRRSIGFVPHYPAHDWYRNMARAMRDRADALGFELKVAAPQSGIAREIHAIRKLIARAAAALVGPGDTILVNSGPLSLMLSDELAEKHDVTIVTNSLDVLERLSNRRGLKVILTSGEYQAKTRCLVGPSLGALFETMRVDRAFLSVDGVSARFGASCTDERLALAARRFADASREVVVMADHSLIGGEASHRIVASGAIADLITDSGSLPGDRLAFASAGVRVTLADEEPEENRLEGGQPKADIKIKA
jgi:DeoR/GlpR family transcriptional regulator of sugar metabolism